MKNKILSMTLCAALIFTMLATPQIQPPAHAEAVALTATVIAVAVTLIVAAGVTWTSVAMGKQCTTQFLTDKPEAKQIIQDIVAAMPQTGVLVLTKTMLPKVKQFMKLAFDYFKGKTVLNISNSHCVLMQNVKMYSVKELNPLSGESDSAYAKRMYGMASYSFNDYITFNNVKRRSFNRKSDSFCFCLKDAGTSSYGEPYHTFTFDSVDVYGGNVETYDIYSDYYFRPRDMSYRFGFYFSDSALASSGYYEVTSFLCSYCKSNDTYSVVRLTSDLSSYIFCLYESSANVVPGYDSIPLDSINIGNIDDVNEAIAHSVGQAAEGVKVDIQKLIEEIEAAKEDALPWTVEGVRELIGIQDELKEIAREQERIRDAIKEGTKEDDMSVPQLPTTITEKFPFCVPFDLIALAKTFSAEPVAPKVTIPVVFDSMHYSHDFVFDFSGDNWDKVAAVIRWGTLIFFILGLTLVTRKLIKG